MSLPLPPEIWSKVGHYLSNEDLNTLCLIVGDIYVSPTDSKLRLAGLLGPCPKSFRQFLTDGGSEHVICYQYFRDEIKFEDTRWEPLLSAISNGYLDVVIYLQTQFNRPIRSPGMYKLIVTSDKFKDETARLDMVKFLLSVGVGIAPIDIKKAIEHNYIKIVDALTTEPRKLKIASRYAFGKYFKTVSMEMIEYLLERDSSNINKALEAACMNGNVEFVEKLLDQGIAINETTVTFEYVLSKEHIEILKCFDRHNINWTQHVVDPVFSTIIRKKFVILDYLIETGFTNYDDALGVALMYAQKEAVDHIYSRHPDKQHCDKRIARYY